MVGSRSLVLAVAASGVVACTTVLGDYTVGGATPGDGGAGDGALVDGAMGDGAMGDGASGDGGTDAPPPLKPLTCSLVPSKIDLVLPALDGGQNYDDSAHMGITPIPGGRYRVIYPGGSTIYFADFQDSNSPPITFSALPLVRGYAMQWARYAASGTSPAGYAFLVSEGDMSGNQKLSVVTLDDTATTLSAPLLLLDGSGGVLPMNGSGNLRSSLAVVDASRRDFLLVVEYSTNNTTFTILGTHAQGATGTVSTIDPSAPLADMPNDAIVYDSSNAYLVMNPPGMGGPPTGPINIYKLALADMSKVSVRMAAPTNGIYAPFASVNSASGAGLADLAFIEADLNSQTALPIIHAGQVKVSDLGTIDLSSVPGATATSINQLPFNKGIYSWWSFGSGDQFLGTGRPLNDGVPGVTFLWLDAHGRLRASVTESDGGNGWPSTLVGSMAATFQGPPTALFAGLRVVWSEGQGTLTAPPKITSMGMNCIAM